MHRPGTTPRRLRASFSPLVAGAALLAFALALLAPAGPAQANGTPIRITLRYIDGLSNTAGYDSMLGPFGTSVGGKTVVMAAVCLLIVGAYRAACAVAARVGGGGWSASRVAMRFAHTLVPIALAYAVAHYFTLVLFEGQGIVSAVSDPFAD